MPEGTNTNPDIKWDGKTWFVTLPVEDGKVLEAKSEPGLTYVIRIRQRGTDQSWSFGFETPIPSCTFVDLKPDTEYDLQVRAKNAAGEGVPPISRCGPTLRAAAATSFPFRDGKDPTAVMHVFSSHQVAPVLPRSSFPPLNLHLASPFPPLRRLTNS